MNRIAFPAEFVTATTDSFAIGPAINALATPHHRFRGEPISPLATFAPMHYEPGYAYPLVVWLHGDHGNEQQLRRVMPLVSMRNYVAVAPRGTHADRARRGAFSWRQAALDIEEAESRICECIDVIDRRFHINEQRVFLVGVGCGGTMAMRLAWNDPGRFAGVASIGGPLPADDRPLRNVNRLRHLPCFVATSRKSLSYPESAVCRNLRLLHAAGCTVALRQYPADDELTTNMLSDFNRWAMEIVCPTADAAVQS
jgi:phospholipase/carboxylesterase